MPAYNSASFLRESIGSVLNQTFRDFDLFVVDDGSSDESWKIIQKFGNDRRVKPIRCRSNQGAAVARNCGVTNSDSDYIAFLDSDDMATPRRLELQVQAIQSTRRFDIVFGRADILNEGKRFNGSFDRLLPEEIPSLLLFRNCIVQSSVLLRRSCWRPLRSEFEPAEDYDLWARLSLKLSFLPLRNVLVHYREHANGISKRLPDRMKKSVAAIHAFQLERLGLAPRGDLHQRLSAWPADAKMRDLEDAERWLRDLVEANRVYPQTPLRRVIEALWCSICLDSLTIGPPAFQMYLQSGFAKLTPRRAWNFARRFGRKALFGQETVIP
jgi:glycosyl transferase family 2